LLPIKDLNRTSTTPHINRLLLIANILIFAVYALSSQGIFFQSSFADYFETHFVMAPNDILHGQMLYTLLTSMFMHATVFHLGGNMLFLYVFGDNIEAGFRSRRLPSFLSRQRVSGGPCLHCCDVVCSLD